MRCVVIAECVETTSEWNDLSDNGAGSPSTDSPTSSKEAILSEQDSPEESAFHSEGVGRLKQDDDSSESRDKVDRGKLLIFTWGHKNSDLPHEIGIKKLPPGYLQNEHLIMMDEEDLSENDSDSDSDDDNRPVGQKTCKVDSIIDLGGHIVGLHLSPDNRCISFVL